eukprot:CAMPEP_0179423140 /NCGR_PEP_ID=MMETSP0799-20121207/10834_1 /TAXON_ID=46947 /ORGANISM="Geminigera cryophila, Strain CCMP2564" /LENGTH=235 /DNA_ID=CAMNT_0021197381 /DNA_START=96 /DNA_END=803 /DNA_ORIENTATION=+
MSSEAAQCAAQDKRILFVRHGVTEMNEFLGSSHYGSPGFKDPGFWDTRLTARGITQAEALNVRLCKQAASWAENTDERIDLIVSSPLSRALHTASLAFAGKEFHEVPRLVNADVRERMWLSSDVGTTSSALSSSWAEKGWDFQGLDETWWYTNDKWRETEWRREGKYVHAGEPEEPFRQRLQVFKSWLLARPERRIAVVAHWGTIYGLTGKSLENCESLEVSLASFYDGKIFVTD